MTVTDLILIAIFFALVWVVRSISTSTNKIIESHNWLNQAIVENGRYLFNFDQELRRVQRNWGDSSSALGVEKQRIWDYLSLLRDIEEKTMCISVDVQEINEKLNRG